MEENFKYTTVERMLLAKASESKSPVNGGMELTPMCNMNCDMCYVRLDKKAVDAYGGLRKVEEWIEIARQMKDAGVLFMLLTGGEPLTYPGFKELYLELLRLGMIVAINTNGTLIDEEWARFFGEHKPRRVNITLYGKDDQTYQELCHYEGGYDRTIRGIKLLREHNVDVKMNCSVAKNNEKDLDELIGIAHELDIPITIDTFMVAATRERELPYNQQSRMEPANAAVARIKALKEQLSEEEFMQYVGQTLWEGYNIAAKRCSSSTCVNCYAGNCSFMITWKGIMKPCVIMEGIEADVFEMGFEKAWNYIVEETGKVRVNEKCASCACRPACSTCAAAAMAETGAYDGIPEYVCQYAQGVMKLLGEEHRQIQEKNLTSKE